MRVIDALNMAYDSEVEMATVGKPVMCLMVYGCYAIELPDEASIDLARDVLDALRTLANRITGDNPEMKQLDR